MSLSNMVLIGNRIKTLIEELLVSVSSDAENFGQDWVTRSWTIPSVAFRRRRSGRGREEDLMRINEGVTIVPMEPKMAYGTNERDGIGYRFLVALVSGSATDTVSSDWPLPIWEQAIRRRFQNKRLGSLGLTTGCELRTTVEPGELPNWAMLSDSVDASFMVITEYIREDRRS